MKRRNHVLLHLCMTCVLSSAVTLTRTSIACYSSGGDCGFHSLSCEDGLTISLGDMNYGFKNQTTYSNNNCQGLLTDCSGFASRKSCCSYDARTDCLKSYSREHRSQVRYQCAGQIACSFHATYVSGGCNNPPFVYDDVSSYSVIHYVCVNGSNPVWINPALMANHCAGCGSPTATSGQGTGVDTSAIPEDKTRMSNDTDRRDSERMLQLIVGVSVGIGSGFIFLVIIVVVCWIRIRRKPPQDVPSVRSDSADTRSRRISRSPSNAHTITSTMPSSHYSSFYYSDTLPSSHPDSIYPDTIYNLPVDALTAGSEGRSSRFRNDSYDYNEASMPVARDPWSQFGSLRTEPHQSALNNASELFSTAPPLSERSTGSQPTAAHSPDETNVDMDGSAPVPSSLRVQRRALPPVPAGLHAHGGSSDGGDAALFGQPVHTVPRTLTGEPSHTVSFSTISGNHNMTGHSGSPSSNDQHTRGRLTSHSPKSFHGTHNINVPTHQEWIQASVRRQRSHPSGYVSQPSPGYAVPHMTRPMGKLPPQQQPHEAVQSWLGNVTQSDY